MAFFNIKVNFNNFKDPLNSIIGLVDKFVRVVKGIAKFFEDPATLKDIENFGVLIRKSLNIAIKSVYDLGKSLKETLDKEVIPVFNAIVEHVTWFIGLIKEKTGISNAGIAKGLFWGWFFGPGNIAMAIASLLSSAGALLVVFKDLSVVMKNILLLDLGTYFKGIGIGELITSSIKLKGVWSTGLAAGAWVLVVATTLDAIRTNLDLLETRSGKSWWKTLFGGEYFDTVNNAKGQIEDFENTYKEFVDRTKAFNKSLQPQELPFLPSLPFKSQDFISESSKMRTVIKQQLDMLHTVYQKELDKFTIEEQIETPYLKRKVDQIEKLQELSSKLSGFKGSKLFGEAAKGFAKEAKDIGTAIKEGKQGWFEKLTDWWVGPEPSEMMKGFADSANQAAASVKNLGGEIKNLVNNFEILKTSKASLKGLTEEKAQRISSISDFLKDYGVDPKLSSFFRPKGKRPSWHNVSEAFDIAFKNSNKEMLKTQLNTEEFLTNLQDYAKKSGITKILLEETKTVKFWNQDLIKNLQNQGKLDKDFIKFSNE